MGWERELCGLEEVLQLRLQGQTDTLSRDSEEIIYLGHTDEPDRRVWSLCVRLLSLKKKVHFPLWKCGRQ